METETVRVGELVQGYVRVVQVVAGVEVIALVNVGTIVKVDVIMLVGTIVSIVVLIIVLMDAEMSVPVVQQDAWVVLLPVLMGV